MIKGRLIFMDKGQVLNRVYESSLPSRAKTIMFYLVNRSNKELTCFPAIPTIARETGLSERTVQRAIKELVEERFIEKSSRYRENGGQSSNLYSLDVESNHQSEATNIEANESEGYVNDVINRNPIHETDRGNGDCRERKPTYLQISDFFSLYNLSPSTLQHICHREGDRYVPP